MPPTLSKTSSSSVETDARPANLEGLEWTVRYQNMVYRGEQFILIIQNDCDRNNLVANINASLSARPVTTEGSGITDASSDRVEHVLQKTLTGVRDRLIEEAVACTTLLRDAELNGRFLIAHESELRRSAWLQASDIVLEILSEHRSSSPATSVSSSNPAPSVSSGVGAEPDLGGKDA